jgi:hypothetical protein
MRNLITGIFALLAGTFFVGGRQMLNDDDRKKSEDLIKEVCDSVDELPQQKTPAPLDINSVN